VSEWEVLACDRVGQRGILCQCGSEQREAQQSEEREHDGEKGNK
jgi:hypothetical protein